MRKKQISIYPLLMMGAFLVVATSCKKDPDHKVPVLTTSEVTGITNDSAKSGGSITDDGGATVTERGVCWSTNPTPTINDSKTSDGSGAGSFTSSITGLQTATKYYLRAYATNSAGTGFGSVMSFTTEGAVDVEGNVYLAVKIGDQTWMTESLRTTKYNDGTDIPHITEKDDWAYRTSDAFCWYNNNIDNKPLYGALYNWYAVSTEKLCPTGWHVASNDDWNQLLDYLGTNAGGKLKETGTDHWNSPNTSATNETGFTARAAGQRSYRGDFEWMGTGAAFWSYIANDDSNKARALLLSSNSDKLTTFNIYKEEGASVRCVKD